MNETNSPVTTLDIRPLLAAGEEPLPCIMRAIQALNEGDTLCLLAPFEPVPLYARLGSMGFMHQATQTSDDNGPLWTIRFSRQPTSAAKQSPGIQSLDVRTLSAAEAAATIGASLQSIAYDEVLKIHHCGPLPITLSPETHQWRSVPDKADCRVTRVWRRM